MDAASNALPKPDVAQPLTMGPYALALHGLVTAVGRYRSQPLALRLLPGQTLALLGGNGAGKTTLLDTIAGFLRPLTGEVWLAGRDCTGEPPEKRRIGYLFQTDALFAHRTVAENLQFGRLAAENLDALLERFDLRALALRRPGQLSGGERQRVALARALAGGPDLVLLDEPLSAIDPATRPALRDELARHLRDCRAPSIMVTHDPADALALGQVVGVMDAGELLQVGPAADVFRRPNRLRTARLLGVENIWPGIVAKHPDETLVRIGLSPDDANCFVDAVRPHNGMPLLAGMRVHVCVRAASLIAASSQQSPPAGYSRLPIRLLDAMPLSTAIQLRGRFGPNLDVLAYAPPWQMRGWTLAPDDRLALHLHAEDVHILQGDDVRDPVPPQRRPAR